MPREPAQHEKNCARPKRLASRLSELYLAPLMLLVYLACRALEHWAPHDPENE